MVEQPNKFLQKSLIHILNTIWDRHLLQTEETVDKVIDKVMAGRIRICFPLNPYQHNNWGRLGVHPVEVKG